MPVRSGSLQAQAECFLYKLACIRTLYAAMENPGSSGFFSYADQFLGDLPNVIGYIARCAVLGTIWETAFELDQASAEGCTCRRKDLAPLVRHASLVDATLKEDGSKQVTGNGILFKTLVEEV
eukprot:4524858-Amphidinium_carterae.1